MSLAKGCSTPPKFIRNNLPLIAKTFLRGITFKKDASWQQFTTLGAGASPFALIVPASTRQLRKAVRVLDFFKFGIFPLGAGTNVAGWDENDSSVIFLKLASDGEFGRVEVLDRDSCLVLCGGGCTIRKVLDYCVTFGIGGAAGLYGIPGTIGGMLKMNAGARGQEIGPFVQEISVMDLTNGKIEKIIPEKDFFSYRKSGIEDTKIVLSAVLKLSSVGIQKEKAEHKAELERRVQSPRGRSAGSVFRNPSESLPAGMILEKCGAKSIIRGSFAVSDRHANWLIDRKPENATEKDLVEAVKQMARQVYDKAGIILKPEIRFVKMQSAKDCTSDLKKLNILVLYGGVSSERDVSLQSGANVAKALRQAGHNVTEYDIQKLEITDEMRKADVVYPVLHGGFGEDGRLQKMLEDAGIKFVGASSKACRIIMDKCESKRLMEENNVSTPLYRIIEDKDAPIPEGLSVPLIVKPSSQGSTFGITLVEEAGQWKDALAEALKYDKQVIVEEFITGIEGTVGIFLGQALPVIEIRYPGKIYDYDAKYTHAQGETLYLCPPKGIPLDLQQKAQEEALKFAKAANATTLVRVDFLIRKSDGRVFILEGNSMPGCTASSLLPKAAASMGISQMEMYSRMAFSALDGK